MKYVWPLVAIFSARFLATAIAFPQVDGDLSWQRWLGDAIRASGTIPRALGSETFTAAGAPWLPQEWLFSILASLARGGLPWVLFSGGVALAAIAALLLSAWRAERSGASQRAVAVCTVLAGVTLLASFGVRVQCVAWLPLVAFLAFLDVDGPWCYGAIAVAALWANLHASAMLAPALAFVAALGTALDDRGWSARTQRLAIVAVGSCAALLCNPFGWHLPAYALALLSSPFKAQIKEWKVTDVDDFAFAWGAAPMFAMLLLAGVRGERRFRDLLLLVVGAVLVLGAARNIAVFGLIALPIAANALTRALPFFARRPEPPPTRMDRLAAWALPATAVALAVLVTMSLLSAKDRTEDSLAGSALAALTRIPGEHRVLCGDFAWCGRIVGERGTKVFLDGRADPYPLHVWNDFATIARLQPHWRERLEAYGVDAVVVARDAPLDQALGVTRGWHQAFADKDYRLWTRAL
jgi:hypothetical protein